MTHLSEIYRNSLKRKYWILGAVILVVVTAWIFMRPPLAPMEPTTRSQVQVERATNQYNLIQTQLVVRLKAHHQQNIEAMERTVIRVEEMFDNYRRGVDPLVEDMTSLGTRFGVLRRMPMGWWYEDDRVQEYVQAKFEHHLFNEASLVDSLRKAQVELVEALRANGNQLQGATGIILSNAALPGLSP